MQLKLISIATLGIAMTASTVQATPASDDGAAFGDLLAQEQGSHDIVAIQRKDGKSDKEIQGVLQDFIVVIQEAQKAGYTSKEDVADFVVFADIECSYQLGLTPKHPDQLAEVVYKTPDTEGADIDAFNAEHNHAAQTTVTTPAPAPIVSKYVGAPKVTSNRWIDDVLVAYGVAEANAPAMKFVGYNAAKQIVSESTDYLFISPGNFQVNLQDAKREIRFVKVVANP